jgi:hypothetical protein
MCHLHSVVLALDYALHQAYSREHFQKGKILIRRLSSVNLDDCGTRRWHFDDKAIRFERHWLRHSWCPVTVWVDRSSAKGEAGLALRRMCSQPQDGCFLPDCGNADMFILGKHRRF